MGACGMKGIVLFDANALDLDKPCRVGRLEPTEFVHGRLVLVVQALFTRQTQARTRYKPKRTSSELRPSTMTLPLSSFKRTTPLTVR